MSTYGLYQRYGNMLYQSHLRQIVGILFLIVIEVIVNIPLEYFAPRGVRVAAIKSPAEYSESSCANLLAPGTSTRVPHLSYDACCM